MRITTTKTKIDMVLGARPSREGVSDVRVLPRLVISIKASNNRGHLLARMQSVPRNAPHLCYPSCLCHLPLTCQWHVSLFCLEETLSSCALLLLIFHIAYILRVSIYML